ncbi:MAG: YbhB/YbcL family Raf kinase inhibitor-like protein [Firmicutes bacterium]|nr:YbhB/YbcL family Raf kinase inhibitor-like protein [Bacillota bacterium]
MGFRLFSDAFENGRAIPDLYSDTRLGRNLSPPLKWEDPPDETQCFAVIAEDVDPPLLRVIPHWVLYNIPPGKRELKEGVPQQELFPDGTVQGKSFFRRNAYMGPNPPFGTHRYYFRIYALDQKFEVDPRMTRRKLLRTIEGHVLGQAELLGTYTRRRRQKLTEEGDG